MQPSDSIESQKQSYEEKKQREDLDSLWFIFMNAKHLHINAKPRCLNTSVSNFQFHELILVFKKPKNDH